MKEKTLKKFLLENKKKRLKKFLLENKWTTLQDEFSLFAKDLTLEEFLNTCQNNKWILWLFKKINPNSFKEIILVKAHCVNTIRHHIKNELALKFIDTAIAFGEGKASKEEIDGAYYDLRKIPYIDNRPLDDNYSVHLDIQKEALRCIYFYEEDIQLSRIAGVVGFAAYITGSDAEHKQMLYDNAYKQNQLETANICRKYLPIEIWDKSKI